MPELPEVETTVREIRKIAKGLRILGVWTDYGSPFHKGKKNIKNKKFFRIFRREVLGRKILDTSRRGKHILIHLSGNITILVHMKMSGHFLYGTYKKTPEGWIPIDTNKALKDPYNRFIHLVFSLSNKKHLAFSDLRKFAKITFFNDSEKDTMTDLSLVGPEPLDVSFTYPLFRERLSLKLNGKIKQVLMDQTIIAGIGNIYSDEILFEAGVHPEERVSKIPEVRLKKMFTAVQKILSYSISIGGDSESDFRNIKGERGDFQNKHKAYHRTGEKCSKKECGGTIIRIKIGGRSAHFCNRHQQLLRQYTQVS